MHAIVPLIDRAGRCVGSMVRDDAYQRVARRGVEVAVEAEECQLGDGRGGEGIREESLEEDHLEMRPRSHVQLAEIVRNSAPRSRLVVEEAEACEVRPHVLERRAEARGGEGAEVRAVAEEEEERAHLQGCDA